MFPVFIPSKGRAHVGRLFEQLPDAEIVVEPQELETYQRFNPDRRFLVLPKDDGGIAYARNFILDTARQRGMNWFWMLDDDLSPFYEVFDRKSVKVSAAHALSAAESYFAELPNAAQASLAYAQFAWSAEKACAVDTACDVCVCINAERVDGLRYREEVELKEDRDFTMQVIVSGARTVRVNRYAFHCPKNGSNVGGLKSLYDLKYPEAKACQRMIDLWGSEVCTVVVKKSGRIDVKINWKALSARARTRASVELSKSFHHQQEEVSYAF